MNPIDEFFKRLAEAYRENLDKESTDYVCVPIGENFANLGLEGGEEFFDTLAWVPCRTTGGLGMFAGPEKGMVKLESGIITEEKVLKNSKMKSEPFNERIYVVSPNK